MILALAGLFLLGLAIRVVVSFFTGLLVMVALHFTSIQALHLGYWDSFWVALAVGFATATASVNTNSS